MDRAATHHLRPDESTLAGLLAGADDRQAVLDATVTGGRRLLGASWAVVLRIGDDEVRATSGVAPGGRWLAAFVEGSRTSARVASGETGPEDVVWAPLPRTSLAFVAGRERRAFRTFERRQASTLARIADARLHDLSRRAHPSAHC